MKKSCNIFLICCLVLSCLSGCRKDENTPENPEERNLPGNLLYDFGEHTYQLHLSTNGKNVYFDRNNYALNGWDVSWDGKTRLESGIVTGEFDKTQFRIINTEDNSIVKEFVYNNVHGEDRQISGLLSPDKSLILLQPDFDHGIVILDTDGNVKYHLPKVNDTELTLGDEVIWLPNNGILFTFEEKYILKSDPPYTSITPIKEMNFANWGHIHASADGSKLSVRVDNHIYLMNIDGTGLVQVTESDREEREAVFSPDGQYLLVAADYYPGTFHAGSWRLNIIPADGDRYKVGNNPGPSTIQLIPNGETNVESGSGVMLWR